MNDGVYKIAFEALGEFATKMIKQKEFDISMLDPEMELCRNKWKGERDAYASVAELYENLKKNLSI